MSTTPATGHAYPPTPTPTAASATPWREVFRALASRKGTFVQVALAAALANLLALATSLYSMQVYDRVIPSQSNSTLVVLTVGAMLATLLELMVRHLRSVLLERVHVGVERSLAGSVYGRLLTARLEALSAGSGVLAAHLRSMDQVRLFATSMVLFTLFDAPFALVFAVFIAAVGGGTLALVPMAFLALALLLGWVFKHRIESRARSGFGWQNQRHGLLVETISSMEGVRAAGRGPELAARWDHLSRECAGADAGLRRGNDAVALWSGWMQQVSYVMLVALGALSVADGRSLTMGALIACSMVAVRVLGPVAALPGLLVQWAHAKVAVVALQDFYALPREGQGADDLLNPARLRGHWKTVDLRFAHPGQMKPLALPDLEIQPGERVAVLGPVGCGKSTFLRLLGGLYAPTQGHVLIDGLSVDQIDRAALRRSVAFMPQDARLISGTLRSNLCAGLDAPSDEQRLVDTVKAVGLAPAVAAHPLGLSRPIGDGGRGLSAGQRQLVLLARLLLQAPQAWLLDEPSASMDDATESRAVAAFRAALQPGHTVVIATHRTAWLSLTDKVIVVTADGRCIVGPRDDVLKPSTQALAVRRTDVASPPADPQVPRAAHAV